MRKLTFFFRLNFIPALVLFLIGCANQNGIQHEKFAPYLAMTESWVINSETNGRQYQISVALPENYYTSDTSYNVLFAVDANMEFGTVVEAARNIAAMRSIENLVIVGIGYPVGLGWNNVMPQRSLDLTPSIDDEWLQSSNENNRKYNLPLYLGTGDAKGFLNFIAQELIPNIEDNYRVKKNGRGLFGHSFGGLFATYSLLQESSPFERYIIGSPSLWWDDGATFLQEKEFASNNKNLKAKVFFAVGGLEEVAPEDARFAMVSNLNKLQQILEGRNYEGVQLKSRIIEDEHHMSVISATVSHGIRYIYAQ